MLSTLICYELLLFIGLCLMSSTSEKNYEVLWLILEEHTVVRFLNPMELTLLSDKIVCISEQIKKIKN
jgi:hypothetical protein